MPIPTNHAPLAVLVCPILQVDEARHDALLAKFDLSIQTGDGVIVAGEDIGLDPVFSLDKPAF